MEEVEIKPEKKVSLRPVAVINLRNADRRLREAKGYRRTLLEGLYSWGKEIESSNSLSLFSETAFPVLVGGKEEKLSVLMAASVSGGSRFVFFPDQNVMNFCFSESSGIAERLIKNLLSFFSAAENGDGSR